MSRSASWLRIGAGSLLLLALVTRAQAWDLLHRCRSGCGASCASETVQLPAQQVVVETARPRVIVHETRPVRAALAPAPVVASFFVPMPLQVGVVGGVTAPAAEAPESLALDMAPLHAAHELERAQARVAAFQAIHEAQMRQVKGVVARMAAARDSAAAPAEAVAPPASSAPSDKCCEDIKAQLKGLNQRVDRLEQLVLFHDSAIREKGGAPKTVVPPPSK